GQWPDTLANLDSQTCPGERWIYEVSPSGEMSLSFSHELAWLETDNQNSSHQPIPLSYRAASYRAALSE
ncbi:MAG: hypothetical protein AAFU53_14840, partial [Cyanobacteria bacterium J06632_3]